MQSKLKYQFTKGLPDGSEAIFACLPYIWYQPTAGDRAGANFVYGRCFESVPFNGPLIPLNSETLAHK
jgi:hypothetical protein